MANYEAYEVSDSSDWLKTPLHSLAPVDAALRCQVCRDYYTTPMITSCSHTFCSLCIRHSLQNDGKCPACKTMEDTSKLRNNYTMEELVDAFKKARPEIMKLATAASAEVRSVSPKRKREEMAVEEESSRKRTRSKRTTRQSSQHLVVLDSEEEGEGDDFVPGKFDYSSTVDLQAIRQTEEETPTGFQCPVCQDYYPTIGAVEAHLDRCTGSSSKPKSRQSSSQTSIQPRQVSKPAKRPDRLAQLHYGTMKDNILQRKLTEVGLAASGNRQLMEKRYTEWVTLWNANCDSRNPKAKAELKREMEVWERTQGGGALFTRGREVNIKDKDFDQAAYSVKHDDSFKGLIEQARRKRTAKKTEPAKAEEIKVEGNGGTTITTMPPPSSFNSPCPTQPSTTDTTMIGFSSSTGEPPREPMAEIPPASSRRKIDGQKLYQESNNPPVYNPPASQEPIFSSDIATVRVLRP